MARLARGRLERLPTIFLLAGFAALLVAAGLLLIYGDANRWVLTSAAIGVIFVIYAVLEQPTLITQGVGAREARYGANSLVMSLAFLGILVLINILAARYYYRLDLTESQEFSLSEQTIRIAQTLPAPVKVTAFFQADQPGREELQDILEEYQRYTDKIELEFVDPVLRPGVARDYNIQTYGTTVVESQGRRATLNGTTESEFTSALLKVSRGESKKVYFVTGHGELGLDQFDQNGASEAKRLLEQENYQVEPLTLATSGTVPADATVVVVAGAREKILPAELDALEAYLAGGGKLLLLVEPRAAGNPIDLLRDWGLEVGDGVVVDAQNLQGDPLTPAVVNYPPNPVMKTAGVVSAFPAAASIGRVAGAAEELQITPIVVTSERSWLETDSRAVQFDDKDTRGPLNLAVAVTRAGAAGQSDGRLVVIGNATFMANAMLTPTPVPGNRDLLLNAVGWLAEEAELLAVRAKSPTDRSLFLTGTQQNVLFFSSTLFLPLAVLLLGVYAWWQRR